jgi:RNA polymerase sigma-70 factor (ECF subfamily)
MNSTADETELVARASVGDRGALAELFQYYRGRLGRTVWLRMDPRLRVRIDVSDVLQEAFLDASRRLPEYVESPEVSLFVWIRSLATQRLVDLHRQHLQAKMRSVASEYSFHYGNNLSASAESIVGCFVDSSRTPGSKAELAELASRVESALAAMAPIDREIIAMRHFEMMTNDEVVEVLKISKGAASNRYVRALNRLHEVLNVTDSS